MIAAMTVATGLALIWWRAESAAGAVLTRPVIATFEARVERIEPLAARELVRLRLAPIRVLATPGRSCKGGRPCRRNGQRRWRSRKETIRLPDHIRVNLAEADVPAGLTRGATITLGARLMPPPQPAVPGAYDYARTAWFDRIGATGRGFAPVEIVKPGGSTGTGLRERLSKHIQESARRRCGRDRRGAGDG